VSNKKIKKSDKNSNSKKASERFLTGVRNISPVTIRLVCAIPERGKLQPVKKNRPQFPVMTMF